MAYGKKPYIDVNSETINQGRSINLSEVGDPGPIELASENDVLKADIDIEAFMNEPVTIRLHMTDKEGALTVETPSVNGINQPIVRGVASTIKRKYVEALARARSIGYAQVRNQFDPTDISMVEKPTLSYPFEVIHDSNPRGRAWLEQILMSA